MAAVRPQVRDTVLAREAEVAHEAELLRELRVVGDHRSAFQRVQELRRMKAEDLAGAIASNAAPVGLNTESMAGVEHEWQPVTIGDLGECVHVTWLAPKVHS
jgi:hypothetical protein